MTDWKKSIPKAKRRKIWVKAMNENKLPKKEILTLALLEVAVAVLTVVVFLVLDALNIYSFSWNIISGAVLGAAVIVLNYLFLTLSVNRAVDNYLSLRGEREMSEEEAAKFAEENSMPIQNAIKTSFITRTVTILATLVVAFVTKLFNPIATVIPLLVFRPLVAMCESIRKKADKEPNPDNFIKFENEKESDE